MKLTKRIISILLACLMLMGMLSVGVFAADGTQDDPINANDKWFGYGVDCYLLNPTFAEGDTDGMWYELTVEQEGILYLEHKYKDVDYTITLTTENGLAYEGGCVDGVINNGPIMTLPVQVGDVATVQIVTKDAAAGTVYANMNICAGTSTDPIKVKSGGITVYVGTGETVYFQDDTLNANYATKGLLVDGSVDETVFYTVAVNSTSGAVTKKAFTDSDGDNTIEAKLGGSLGSAGAPPVKPMWAIENNSTTGIGTAYSLTIVDDAHECNWDDDTDADCNTCGATREIIPACEHEYFYPCDKVCMLCYEETRPDAEHNIVAVEAVEATCADNGNIAHWYCSDCGCVWADEALTQQTNRFNVVIPATDNHAYADPFDTDCNNCGEVREVPGITAVGDSVSEDVNGLAMRFTLPVEGMKVNGTTAIYDNATIGGYKLIGMGAIVWADSADPYNLEDANGKNVLNVPAVRLYDKDDKTGTVSYAIRVINIPDEHKDTPIHFRSYFIYEDEAGTQHIVYGDIATGTYNGCI